MVISTDLRGIGKLVVGSAYFPYDGEANPPEEVRTLVAGGLLQGKESPTSAGVRYQLPPYIVG